MYVSRLTFHTVPGRTSEVERRLEELLEMVQRSGGLQCRLLHTHFASLGAPDVVFEQQASDLAALEAEIEQVAESEEFQRWTEDVSSMLLASPKREIYRVVRAV